MTAEELMTIANMGKGTDMSSYEHFMMAEKSARRPSGVGIAGLAIGSTALLAAVGAWIFGGVYANSQSKGNQRAIDILATTALAERAERVNHQNNQTPNNLDIIRIITNAQSGAGAGGILLFWLKVVLPICLEVVTQDAAAVLLRKCLPRVLMLSSQE